MKEFFLLVLAVASVYGQPCSTKESLDITHGELFGNGSVVCDGVEYVRSAWYEAEVNGTSSRMGCPCIGRLCVWKCCPEGQAYYGRQCEESALAVVNPFSPPVFRGAEPAAVAAHERFFFMSTPLCEDKYVVDSSSPYDEMYLQEVSVL